MNQFIIKEGMVLTRKKTAVVTPIRMEQPYFRTISLILKQIITLVHKGLSKIVPSCSRSVATLAYFVVSP